MACRVPSPLCRRLCFPDRRQGMLALCGSWLTSFQVVMLEHKALVLTSMTRLSGEQRCWGMSERALEGWEQACCPDAAVGKPLPGHRWHQPSTEPAAGSGFAQAMLGCRLAWSCIWAFLPLFQPPLYTHQLLKYLPFSSSAELSDLYF